MKTGNWRRCALSLAAAGLIATAGCDAANIGRLLGKEKTEADVKAVNEFFGVSPLATLVDLVDAECSTDDIPYGSTSVGIRKCKMSGADDLEVFVGFIDDKRLPDLNGKLVRIQAVPGVLQNASEAKIKGYLEKAADQYGVLVPEKTPDGQPFLTTTAKACGADGKCLFPLSIRVLEDKMVFPIVPAYPTTVTNLVFVLLNTGLLEQAAVGIRKAEESGGAAAFKGNTPVFKRSFAGNVPIDWTEIPAGTIHFRNKVAAISDFKMMTTEVTNSMYAECVRAGECEDQPGEFTGKNRPKDSVDIRNADRFCRWVGGELPTEEEWLYAASAGRDVKYPWGNEEPTRERAQFTSKDTAEVGSHPAGANPWGLHDMAGNLTEWTTTQSQKGMFVLLGGYWARGIDMLNLVSKTVGPGWARDSYFGFRCKR